jgi:uncharacterized repeat protein (TIGR03803 family)
MCIRAGRVALIAASLLVVPSGVRAQGAVDVIWVTPDSPYIGDSVVIAPDGSLYSSLYSTVGTSSIYRITPAGAAVVATLPGGVARLVLSRDGYLYGIADGPPQFAFRMTLGGDVTVLHEFTGLEIDGLFSFFEASDGNLYGGTIFGGYDRDGILFRLTRTGEYTMLHSFSLRREGMMGVWGLMQASDGYLYASLATGVIRATLEGAITKIITPPYTTFVSLAEGRDGALYGSDRDGGYGCGSIYRIARDGSSSSVIHSFLCRGEYQDVYPFAPLLSAADGFLYGTAGDWIFRIDVDGTYTRLVQTPRRTGIWDPAHGPLVQAPGGEFYGVKPDGLVFRFTPSHPVSGFDADTKSDMPLYDDVSGTWRILTSTSGHSTALTVTLGARGDVPVPADYDGDGRLDVAVYRPSNGVWHILTSSSDFTTEIVRPWGGIGYMPVPGDFDGDKKADFTVFRPATGKWHILHSSTNCNSASTIALGGIGSVPVPGDYDGDGRTDVALYRPASGEWDVLTSHTNFTTLITKTLGGPGDTAVPGDYDGDWRTDFAVYHQATGAWSVLQSSSDFTTTWSGSWGGAGYTAVPGDYDGDNRNDLAVYYGTTGDWFVLLSGTHFESTIHAVFGEPQERAVTSVPHGPVWTDQLRASDYDGDGISDIAVYETATGAWSIKESSTNFTAIRGIVWGANGDLPVPGDYDFDGLTDVATFNASSGAWSVQLTSGRVLTVTLGSPGDIPFARDYDGDLITDMAVYTPSTGVWRMLLSGTGFTVVTSVTWGDAGWTPVPGDYDADGKADLGLYQPSTGAWRILLAASNFTTQLAIDWGGPDYAPVPGDYDGDGKYDFAVCIKATGQWYVLKSGFTYTTAFGLPWGEGIDTPLAADYDGDGISDMVAYDSATGEWYVRLSSSYFTLSIQRTLGGPGYVPAR